MLLFVDHPCLSPTSPLCLFLSLRYSIDPQSDPEALFRITPDTGLITTTTELDREHEQWHNITIIATQRGITRPPSLTHSSEILHKGLVNNRKIQKHADLLLYIHKISKLAVELVSHVFFFIYIYFQAIAVLVIIL